MDKFEIGILGKKQNQVIVRQGIHIVILIVMRVSVINYGDGMEHHQKKEDMNKIVYGI
jgi:hypothetical protein